MRTTIVYPNRVIHANGTMKSQSTENLDAHRICERMLLALNAPVTDANIAKLGFFAGIISSMNAKTVSLEAIEALIMGVDMTNKFGETP